MRFNSHYELQGSHAFLSASSYHWVNYTEDKLEERYRTNIQAQRGIILHEFAAQAIKLGVKLQASSATLNKYVNDCISYGMIPEQVLFFSVNAFGTADAIKLKPARGNSLPLLMIFDLKTGVTKVKFTQLLVYCAFFCLEYDFKPTELDYDLRIYQNDAVERYDTDSDDIVNEVLHIMDRIKTFDRLIEEMKAEALL